MAVEVYDLPAQVSALLSNDSLLVSNRTTVAGSGFRTLVEVSAVMRTAGLLVDGAGTANKIALWSDANTLTVLPDQVANTVLAGPTFGNPNAHPTFRALESADIPTTLASARTFSGAVTLNGDTVIAANSLLTVGDGTGSAATLRVNGANSTYRGIFLQTAGLDRFAFRIGNGNEAGSDVASNLNIISFNDAGTQIDIPITINRVAGGNIVFSRPTTQAYNWSQTGATTFSTGTGAVTLNGDTVIAANSLLTLGNTAVAATPVATHTVTIKDAAGTTYRLLCVV